MLMLEPGLILMLEVSCELPLRFQNGNAGLYQLAKRRTAILAVPC